MAAQGGIPSRSYGALQVRARRFWVTREVLLPTQAFIHTEGLGGVLLLAAAVVALLWANSPWSSSYHGLWETAVAVDVGVFALSESLRHWINDGLMALFFFVVGLEIKRELVRGELAEWRRAALPAAAALGGMMVPALFYLLFNWGGEGARGWGIPMATDIAFALGVLTLVGRRVPVELKVFLLALAIVDDIGAILVIALFYTDHLALAPLGMAAGLVVVLLALQRLGIQDVRIYALVGVLVWLAVHESGVHATVAGVLLGVLTPAWAYLPHQDFPEAAGPLLEEFRTALAVGDDSRAEATLGELEELTVATEAPVERLERRIHPWTSFFILPLFALANSGVPLSGEMLRGALANPVVLGIVAGLVAGKLLGVLGFSWVAVRLGVALLPSGVSWRQVFGVALLAGIGFTVAIFIATLAFEDKTLLDQAKIGILAASLVAGLLGWSLLRFTSPVPG